MGFWGIELYENDYTLDIRDTFTEPLKKYSIEESITILKNEYLEIGDINETLFWYALADTEKDYGITDEKSMEEAMKWLDLKGREPIWKNAKDIKKW